MNDFIWIFFGKDFNFKFRVWLWLGTDLWEEQDIKVDKEENVEAVTFSNNSEYLKKVMEIE